MNSVNPIIRVTLLAILTCFVSTIYGSDISDLIKYSKNGDLTNIKSLIEKGIDINSSEDKRGNTALIAAVSGKQYATVEYLISQGADVNRTNSKGNTALHTAIEKGDKVAVKLLLTHNASTEIQTDSGVTPLFMAIIAKNKEIFELLLDNGADINANMMAEGFNDKFGLTILHNAVGYGDIKLVKYLLSKGADTEVRDSSGYTPLLYVNDNIEMAKLLIDNGAYVNALTQYGTTPLSHAVGNNVQFLSGQGGNVSPVAQLLINNKAWSHFAPKPQKPAWLNKFTKEEVKAFISKGGDINQQDANGNTALHWITSQFFLKLNDDFLNSLLQNNINLSAKNYDGNSPLHFSCMHFNVEMVKFLLDNNVDPNIKNKNKIAPLHNICNNPEVTDNNGSSTQIAEKIIELLLEHGADINIEDSVGKTPLHYAASTNMDRFAPFVQFLLDNGADIDAQDIGLNTPLHEAVDGSTAVVELLLSSGANPNIKNIYGHSSQKSAEFKGNKEKLALFAKFKGIGSIHNAAEHGVLDKIKSLVEQGTDVNSLNENGFTALQIATWSEQLEAVKLLIELGAEVNLATDKMITPLHYAVDRNNINIANVLLDNKASVDIDTLSGTNAAGEAFAWNRLIIYDTIMELYPEVTAKYVNIETLEDIRKQARIDARKDKHKYFNHDVSVWATDSKSKLHQAVYYGDKSQIVKLLSKGADINGFDAKGDTPLNCAVNIDNEDIFNLLIKKGADINKLNKNGTGLIHSAADQGRVEFIELLLNKGIDINQKAKNGQTAFHYAVGFDLDDTMQTLLENGADINAVDNEGKTPLLIAIKCLELNQIWFLLKNGADINHVDNKGRNVIDLVFENWEDFGQKHVDVISYLMDIGVNYDKKDLFGKNLLHKAVEELSIPLVKILLEKGFDANSPDSNGNTPIHIHTDPFYERNGDAFEMMSLLIQYGADVNKKSCHGLTPLYGAVELNKPKIVQLLIDKGADVNTQSSSKTTPLHVAVQKKNYDMVKLLLENKADTKAKDRFRKTPADMIKFSMDEDSKKIKELLNQY